MSPAIRGWLETLSICWSPFTLAEATLDQVRCHITAFRYRHEVVREFKVQRSADKLSPQSRHLLKHLADLTDAGQITTTANWRRKDTYRGGGGPTLASRDQTWKFRHYQLPHPGAPRRPPPIGRAAAHSGDSRVTSVPARLARARPPRARVHASQGPARVRVGFAFEEDCEHARRECLDDLGRASSPLNGRAPHLRSGS